MEGIKVQTYGFKRQNIKVKKLEPNTEMVELPFSFYGRDLPKDWRSRVIR